MSFQFGNEQGRTSPPASPELAMAGRDFCRGVHRVRRRRKTRGERSSSEKGPFPDGNWLAVVENTSLKRNNFYLLIVNCSWGVKQESANLRGQSKWPKSKQPINSNHA
jgi:hypothetical protein